jgi:hypothetical protein
MTNDGLGSFNDRLFPLLKVFYRDRPKKQHDAGISGIDAPWGNSCSGTRVPKVSITNYGSTTLTSAIIRYNIDGGAPVDFNWTGSLATGDTIRVVLPQINISAGSHTFTCYTTLPNGTPEGNNYNDTARSNFVATTTPAMLAEIVEGFEGAVFPPSGWSESNPTHFSWDRTTLAYHSGGVSVVKNNWNDYRVGSTYDLDLPLIHVAGGTHPRLEFNYAYALYPNYFGDTLQVLVSNDCGATWHKLFNKGGADLPTADTTRLRFYPRGGDDWQHEAYSLAAYPGDLQIRFRNVCGFGQNLYLDNVMVSFPTNVTGNQAQFDFNLYPNPSSSVVNISGLPVNSEILITDLAGKLLLKENTKSSIATVNIDHLPKGIYILKSNSGAKKIVKL